MDVFITPIVSMTCLNKFLANVLPITKKLWMMSRMDVFITPIVSMTCLNKFLANVQY